MDLPSQRHSEAAPCLIDGGVGLQFRKSKFLILGRFRKNVETRIKTILYVVFKSIGEEVGTNFGRIVMKVEK